MTLDLTLVLVFKKSEDRRILISSRKKITHEYDLSSEVQFLPFLDEYILQYCFEISFF